MKPAVKTRPHHRGGRIQPKQPINKTIGINKLGTLLSSQTTDTPGTTQTNVQDRSGATFQTYPTTGSFANQRFRNYQLPTISPHPNRHAQKRTISRPFEEGGLAANFPHQRRRLRKQYTPTAHPANQPQPHPHTPKKP
ncbi:hypothetical protein RKD54_000001, partial [Pseudarthrobacter sp. SLBN-100]